MHGNQGVGGEGTSPATEGSEGGRAPGAGLGLALITLGAALPRLIGLGREALWFDEVNTLYRASADGVAGVLARSAADVQAPLYDLLTWVVAGPLGRHDAWALRLSAALAGIALVPVAGALALALTARRSAALFGALLVAVCPFAIRFAQEARPYSLLALLSGLLLLGATRALTSGGRAGLALVAIVGPLIVLTHYYGVLLFAAVALALLAGAARYGARLPRVAWALLPALLALGAWSPVALRQISLREMNTVYAPLDGPMLLEILDAQGVAASLRTAPLLLRQSLGATAAALAPWGLWLGRVLLLLLVGWGWRAARRQPGGRAPQRPGSCRAPALALLGLGLALVAGTLWLPDAFVQDIASALFKGGRPLDAENLAFVARLRGLMLPAGGALATLAAALACLPALARRSGAGPAPGVVLQAAVLLPLLAPLLLDLTGKYTLATRNMIMLLPAVAVLAARGWSRLAQPGRGVCAALIVAVAALGLAAGPAYGVKRDWRAAAAVVEQSGLEAVTYPPWLARCVEYHTGRPWHSVFGSWRAEDVAVWAATRPGAVLVEAHATPDERAAVEAALEQRFGSPEPSELRGISCQVYRLR